MAAVTILGVEQGWAGDRKRHLVALLAATGSTFMPSQVGLQKVEAVIDAGLRSGTITVAGTTVTLTDHGTHVISTATDTGIAIALQTTANCIWYVYGW